MTTNNNNNKFKDSKRQREDGAQSQTPAHANKQKKSLNKQGWKTPFVNHAEGDDSRINQLGRKTDSFSRAVRCCAQIGASWNSKVLSVEGGG
jgi:hypothetical protein